MKIRKEASYVLENEDGMTALAPTPGQSVRLEFEDGKYHNMKPLAVVRRGASYVEMINPRWRGWRPA